MKKIQIAQGSPEWLELRKTKITSTDASIINGSNTFWGNSPYKLWRQKLGLEEKDPVNHAMLMGHELEKEARDLFNKLNGTNFQPEVILHDNEWIMASLDGYDKDSDYILEIKSGEKAYDQAFKGLVPSYYFDQIHHQLYASGKQLCYYMAYRPDKEPITIVVKRDEHFLETLIEKEKEFYDCLINLVPPEVKETDFIELETESAIEIALKWKETYQKIKNLQEDEKKLKNLLIEETDDGNCIISKAGVKIERRVKLGSYDYKKLINDFKIDSSELEKYRKPESSWMQPSLIKKA